MSRSHELGLRFLHTEARTHLSTLFRTFTEADLLIVFMNVVMNVVLMLDHFVRVNTDVRSCVVVVEVPFFFLLARGAIYKFIILGVYKFLN